MGSLTNGDIDFTFEGCLAKDPEMNPGYDMPAEPYKAGDVARAYKNITGRELRVDRMDRKMADWIMNLYNMPNPNSKN